MTPIVLVKKEDVVNALTKQINDALRLVPELYVRPQDAVERKKGEWQITDAYPHNVYCSECHKKFAQTHWAVWEDGSLPRNFCPNCGADMRETEDEKANT